MFGKSFDTLCINWFDSSLLRRHTSVQCASECWSSLSLCAGTSWKRARETEYVAYTCQATVTPDNMRAKTKYFMWMWKTQHKHINIFAAITNNELITIRRGFNISAFEMRTFHGEFQLRFAIEANWRTDVWMHLAVLAITKYHSRLPCSAAAAPFFSSKWQSKFSTRSLSLSLCTVQSVRSMIGVTRWI